MRVARVGASIIAFACAIALVAPATAGKSAASSVTLKIAAALPSTGG